MSFGSSGNSGAILKDTSPPPRIATKTQRTRDNNNNKQSTYTNSLNKLPRAPDNTVSMDKWDDPIPPTAATHRIPGEGCAAKVTLYNQQTTDRWRILNNRLETRLRGDSTASKLYLSATRRAEVLHYMHSTHLVGHPGGKQTMRNMLHNFHWPGMLHNACKYVRECLPYINFKAQHADGEQHQGS
ncbi:hypothetical protein PR048_020920 [Dryococelus australis]|uniref:Integrase zinc-binding domain-containing protein n=1 Tax=Dryococelus australis TaxID=614101 RepID=A0ABQ9GWS5_9NEOP|nr:hypothetical protein PR048_020920 [Dryococelus australis]